MGSYVYTFIYENKRWTPLHFDLFATFEFSSLSKNLKFEQKYEFRAKKSYFKESRLVSEYNLAFLQYLRVRLLLY